MYRPQLIFALVLIAFFSLLLSLSKGSTSIPFDQLLFSDSPLFNPIILQLRLSRTLMAFIAGGLLALAGSLMQILLQNPLSDPYVMGVSGGAAFATLLLMLLGVQESELMLGAWVGSLVTMLLMTALARKHRWEKHTLLLSGIALGCGFSACISCLLLLTPDRDLHSMLFWLAGDLNHIHFPWQGLIVLSAGICLCALLAPGLNILGRGEKESYALGLSSKNYRIMLYILSSLFTATAVTMVGCVGFVGLVVPHIARLLTGYDHRLSLPASMLLGGSLLTLADTGARTLFAPQQLPVGMLMALLGVPIFIWLVQK